MNKIISHGIGAGSFFKLLIVGSVFTHILLVLVVMVGTLLGLFTPSEANIPMPLWKSELFLLGYLLVGVLLTPIWAGIFWLGMYPGIWFYSKFKPMALFYKPAPNTGQ